MDGIPLNVNPNPKIYLALIGLGLFRSGALLAEEPANPGKVSRRIKEAVRAGFPDFNGKAFQAPAEKPAVEVDPDVLALPVVRVSSGGGLRKMDGFATAPKTETVPLVAGTGITEFKGKKFTILVPRILFIPIGISLKW